MEAGRLKLLVIEDSEADFALHARNLKQHGMEADLRRVDSLPGIERALDEPGWDAVLSDYSLPGVEFRQVLARIRERLPEVPVLLVSGSIGEEIAVDLLREGVWDFLWKDRPARLTQALTNSLEEARSRKARKQAEAALRASEKRYRSLFENMLDGFAGCSLLWEDGRPVDWTFLEVNASFLALTGLRDVAHRRVLELLPDLRRTNPELFAASGRVAFTGVPERLETFVPALGKWFSIGLFNPAPGEIVMLLGDISERKKAEGDLKEAMQRLKIAIAAGGYGVWDRQLPEGGILWDERNYRIYGVEAGTPLPGIEAWLALLHPEDRARARAEVTAALEGAGELDLAYRIVRPDGSIRHVHSMGTVLRDASGLPQRILGLAEDITERIKAEEERRALEAQLHHAEKLESLGSLAGGVAHDMNNVLAAILAVSQVLRQKQEEDPSLASALDTIIRAGNRGRDLVKGLTNFARKDLRSAQALDLNRLVRDEAALLERTLLQKVRLEVDLEEGLPCFLGEPGPFGSALMNLCVNAVDAMPGGGTLTLRTRAAGPAWVELVVGDTGTGMPPEVVSRALEPFYTTKDPGKGTGLGLSVVHGTVKSHGGTLEIQSRLGEGTRIIVRLPAMAAGQDAGSPSQIETHRTKSLKVLLVDDDDLIQATVPLLLRHLGHQPHPAASGEEGLRLLAEGLRPDVVVLDLNMPGLGGEAAYRQIRKGHPHLPVLMATGFMDPSTAALLEGDTRAGTITKPFTIEELSRKLADFA